MTWSWWMLMFQSKMSAKKYQMEEMSLTHLDQGKQGGALSQESASTA